MKTVKSDFNQNSVKMKLYILRLVFHQGLTVLLKLVFHEYCNCKNPQHSLGWSAIRDSLCRFPHLLHQSWVAHPPQIQLRRDHRQGCWPRRTENLYCHQTLDPRHDWSCLCAQVKVSGHFNNGMYITTQVQKESMATIPMYAISLQVRTSALTRHSCPDCHPWPLAYSLPLQ